MMKLVCCSVFIGSITIYAAPDPVNYARCIAAANEYDDICQQGVQDRYDIREGVCDNFDPTPACYNDALAMRTAEKDVCDAFYDSLVALCVKEYE